MPTNLAEAAIEILQNTRDGDDLAPQHLKLVENAVNGFLTEAGRKAFDDLLANVRSGYTKPWFHGVEHLTYDHEGYVRWKNLPVEHFSPSFAHTEAARQYVQELAQRCLAIEARGETPSTESAVWRWPETPT